MMIDERTELDTHTLFGALTRPAMTAGVTFEFHGINLIVSVCAFIAMGNLLYGLVFIPAHIFGWLVCRADPRYFEVLFKRMRMPSNPNQAVRGVRYYEPY